MPTPPRDYTTPRDTPIADREVELKVAVHADGRQIVVRRQTEADPHGGQRTLHIDAVVR
jgi:hypothetical protein